MDIKALLDYHANLKNCDENLFAMPDPLQVAKREQDPIIALLCALFAYGNAGQIVKFLSSLDFSLLNAPESEISRALTRHKYRFQNPRDVAEIFITARRLRQNCDIEQIFASHEHIVDGINALISEIYALNPYRSQGYEFFWGKGFQSAPKSPYKRYNMYLRWMVRRSDIDLGLFTSVDPAVLLMPLDVHTHRVSLSLGLMRRKSYDFGAVLELTERLREFDPRDPIKYDFALYRLGQSGEFREISKNLKGK